MKTLKSDTSQTIFDVAMLQYGGLQGLSLLLADNPELINDDGSIQQFGVSHLVSKVDVGADELEKAGAQNAAPLAVDQRPEYRSNVQQTVFDVALMQYGSVGGLIQLLTDNPTLIQPGGTISQFRIAHKIQPGYASDKRLKPKMLALVPCTEMQVEGQSGWITDDNQPWITNDNQPWVTDI